MKAITLRNIIYAMAVAVLIVSVGLNMKDSRNHTALVYALKSPSVFHLLLRRGISLDELTTHPNGHLTGIYWDSDTSLQRQAVSGDNLEAARILLEAGADPNQKDKQGHTALEGVKDPGMLRLLLAHGARR